MLSLIAVLSLVGWFVAIVMLLGASSDEPASPPRKFETPSSVPTRGPGTMPGAPSRPAHG